MASYVLIAILKKRLGLAASLHEILQVLSLNLFEKTPILQACWRHSCAMQKDQHTVSNLSGNPLPSLSQRLSGLK